MKPAEKLSITTSTLVRIKRLARAARQSREAEADLYHAIETLPNSEKAELLALANLGRAGSHCSFNVALASAIKQDPARIAQHLADNSRFVDYLAKGLKRHDRQSE